MVSYNQEKLAHYVRAYRDSEGLSQRALAARCNGAPSAATISRIENMQKGFYPDIPTLVQLLSVIHVDVNQIFGGETAQEQVQINDLSTQLRASKTVSAETLQALAAIIQAVQAQQVRSDRA